MHTVVNLLTDTSGPYFDLVRLVGILAAVAAAACTVAAVAERRAARAAVMAQVVRIEDYANTARAEANAAAFNRRGASANR
jgi:hypothetical protein